MQYFIIKKPKTQSEILSYIKSYNSVLRFIMFSRIFMKNDDIIKKSRDLAHYF